MSNWLADTIDNVGTFFNAPDWGISESQAGGRTSNTGRVPYSGNTTNNRSQAIGDLVNTSYNQNQAWDYLQNQQREAQNRLSEGGQTGYSQGDGNGSSVYNGPNYAQQNAAAIGQLGQSESTINNALNRLGVQQDIAFGNLDKNYGTRTNELNTQKATNENNYNQSTTQNQQSFRGNKNVINDQASSGLTGLQRLLGSYGAVGSDLGLAGRAVGDVASQQNAGAGQNFSQNQQSLDTNWGNYRNEWDNERKKVDDWRNQQRQQVEQQTLTTRQDLLSKLGDIRGQIAAARGGNYASSAQPFLDQANGLSSRIDQLGAFNPTYTGVTPQYQAPELSSYDTGNGATIGAAQGQVGGMNTPFLNALLGNRDKKQQLV